MTPKGVIMMKQEILTMSQNDIKRLHIIQKVVEKSVKQIEAAKVLNLSDRQVRRLQRRVEQHGASGVKHGSCGKRSRNATDEKQKEKILGLYRSKYERFGPTLACEKLLGKDKIRISRESLRQWLMAEGLWEKKRKGREHRQWRERKSHYGEMVQMDGSHHDWLEGRGPKIVLIGYIDDATSRVYGRFYDQEGTIPAMDSFKKYVKSYGIPASIYLDRHAAYKCKGRPSIAQELAGEEPLSEFERVLKELGVEVIHAMSPEAKGRVERLFRTLQDRLVKEMRLEGIKTLQEANDYLDKYWAGFNKRFSVQAREDEDLHRRMTKMVRLESVFCFRRAHILRNDFTVADQRKLYQVLDTAHVREVEVQENLDGQIKIVGNGRCLRYKEIHQRQKAEKVKKKPGSKRRQPDGGHPWRSMYKPKTGRFNFAENRTF
jgi:transposase